MDLRSLKSGTLVVLIGSGFLGGAGLLISMLMTRLVTPAEMGVYFLIFQVVNVARIFSEGGMNVGLQKLVGVALADDNPGAVKAHTLSVFALLGILTLLTALGLWLGWGFIAEDLFEEPALLPFAVVAIVWLVFRGVEDIANVFFRSLSEIPKAVFGCGVPRQLFLLVALVALFFTYGALSLESILWVISGTWALGGLLALGLVAHRLLKIKVPANIPFIEASRDILTLSVPMLLHTGAAVILSTADLWVLGAERSSDEVGFYGALMRVAASMAFILGVVNMVLPPMLARLYRAGETQQMEALLRRAAAWGSWLALPMAVAFIGFGGPLLGLFFGDAYEVGGSALALLALAHGFNTLSGSPGYVLQMTGNHVALMRVTLFVAALNLIGNILVVGPYGMVGVASITALSLVMQNLMMTTMVYRRLGIKTWVKLPLIHRLIG